MILAKTCFICASQPKNIMELLYIWIDKYKNIEKQGFNFSPKYDFEFKSEPTVMVKGELFEHKTEQRKELKNTYKDFFNTKISNVTAIIGENGSGKSSIINLFLNLLVDIDKKNDYKGFILIFKQEEQKYKIYKDSKLTITNYPSFINATSDSIQVDNIKKQIETIFYCDYFTHSSKLSYISYNDISTSFLLRNPLFGFSPYEDNRQELYDYSPQTSIFFYQEYQKMVDFILWYQDAKEPFSESVSKAFRYLLQIKNIEFRINDFKGTSKTKKLLKHFEEKKWKINSFEIWVLASIIERFGVDEEDITTDNISHVTNFDDIINTVCNNLSDSYNGILKETLIDLKAKKTEIQLLKSGEITIEIQDSGRIKQILDCCKLIYFDYINIYFTHDGTDNRIQLSSGETTFLRLLARLHSIAQNIKESKSILLFLDEGELGMHPQWQKSYLDILHNILPIMFEKSTKIQLVFTSHSPFIVSDLPKENIIFLRKGKKDDGYLENKCIVTSRNEQTFGQNIHTLFADSFFMESGLIGEFAKNKINTEIITVINGFNKENSITKEQAESLSKKIEMIGEPLIKRKLTMMLEEKVAEAQIEIQIAYHEFKLNQLKGGK